MLNEILSESESESESESCPRCTRAVLNWFILYLAEIDKIVLRVLTFDVNLYLQGHLAMDLQ